MPTDASYNRTFTASSRSAGSGSHSVWDTEGKTLHIDAAPAFGGEGKGASPLANFLASVASCQQVTANVVLKQDATLQGKSIDKWEWKQVEGSFNSEQLETGIEADHLTWTKVIFESVIESSTLSQADINNLIAQTERGCPLTTSLIKAGATVINDWHLPGQHSDRVQKSSDEEKRADNSVQSNPAYERTFSTASQVAGKGTHSIWNTEGKTLHIDAAPAFGGEGKGASPLSNFLASVAGCQQVTANAVLKSDNRLEGKSFTSFEWKNVTGSFNSKQLEKGTEEESITWDRVDFIAELKSETLTQADIDLLVQEVERRCPLTGMLIKGGSHVNNDWKLVK